TQRIKNRRQVVGDIGRQLEHVGGRQAEQLAKAARPVHPHAHRVAAQVAAAGAAVATVAAGDVPFARDAVAGLVLHHLAAHLFNHAHVFVAGDHRDRDGPLGPIVPVVDVNVGPADGGLRDADQHIVGADGGLGDVVHPEPRFAILLDEGLHATTFAAEKGRAVGTVHSINWQI